MTSNSKTRTTRSRYAALAIGALILLGLAAAGIDEYRSRTAPSGFIDPADSERVALGKQIYQQHCAACHGAQLEGQPDWQRRLPSGRMPAPPHDETGHTWHHPDRILVGITTHGVTPPFGPPGYESDMPGFGGVLSAEEIAAVLAYIKSSWPPQILAAQRDIDERDRQR